MSKNDFVSSLFVERHKHSPQVIVKAPGRVNLIGEHTDYNAGLVMPAAIDKCMYMAMSRNENSTVTLYAADLDEHISFPVEDLRKTDFLWANYFKGVLSIFAERQIEISGFNCVLSSDIPIGSGLSSSAALECGLIKGLDYLFDKKLTDWDIVRIGNAAENNYLGIGSGILDQFGSTFGKKDKAMKMHCGDHSFEYLDMDLGKYSFLLLNTNVKHEHLTSGYNKGPKECKEALEIINKKYASLGSLSEVTTGMLDEDLGLPQHLYDRVQYIVEENARVLAFENAMINRDIATAGEVLYASHQGLQHLYKVSCEELDLLVDLTRQYDGVAGSRMMGGGFGGCTISLIETARLETIVAEITSAYTDRTKIVPEVYTVGLSDGVHTLSN